MKTWAWFLFNWRGYRNWRGLLYIGTHQQGILFKNSKGEDGYWKFAPENAITVKPVPVPYYYENSSPITKDAKANAEEDPNYKRDNETFRMRVDYIMKFFKKHYDDGSPPSTYETLRPDDDIEDTPQGPPEPDATGAIFSGVSS